MTKKTIESNVIIATKEELFFKEVVFDFASLPSEVNGTKMTPNIASKLFLIQNVDESVTVKAYPTRDRAIMFNAWITKNISYKVAAQSAKKTFPPIQPITPIIPCFPLENSDTEDTSDTGFGLPAPGSKSIEMVGVAVKDSDGYPTVYGPLYHMTKIIDFGGFIALDLPPGEVLRDTDIVEVLVSEIVGSHDELLDPEPIFEATTEIIKVPNPNYNPFNPFSPKYIDVPVTKYREFDPKLTQYARLREKMTIKIKVRVIRKEIIVLEH